MSPHLLDLVKSTHGVLHVEASAHKLQLSSMERVFCEMQREMDGLRKRNAELEQLLERRDDELREMEEKYKKELEVEGKTAREKFCERKNAIGSRVSFRDEPVVHPAGEDDFGEGDIDDGIPSSQADSNEDISPVIGVHRMCSKSRISSFFPACEVTEIMVASTGNEGRFFHGDVGGDQALTREVLQYRNGELIHRAQAKIWRQGAGGCWSDLTELHVFQVGDSLVVSSE